MDADPWTPTHGRRPMDADPWTPTHGRRPMDADIELIIDDIRSDLFSY